MSTYLVNFFLLFERMGKMETIDVIRNLCVKHNTSLKALERELGFSNGSLAKSSTIKSERLKKIADYFGVSVEYLMTGEEPDGYYLNNEARDMAQFLYDNPGYKVLFDASRKVKPDDIKFVAEMIDRMTKNED